MVYGLFRIRRYNSRQLFTDRGLKMSLYDSQGREIRKVPEEQILNAINTLAKRTESHQMQLMQLGMLLEFVVEKLSNQTLPNGTKVLELIEDEFNTWSENRFAEIKSQAERFRELAQAQEANTPAVELDE